MRRAAAAAVQVMLNLLFRPLQRLGISVVPNNFYSPVPDMRGVGSSSWPRPSDLPGLSISIQKQQALLTNLSKFRSEYDAFPRKPTGRTHDFHLLNGNFQSVDAEVLYAMVRFLRPSRVIEIGSGYSTLLMASAVRQNAAEGLGSTDLVACDPYPTRRIASGLPCLRQLIQAPVQSLPLHRFLELQSGDVLFIDSSHVLKFGSDVQYLYLEVLPRLARGVIVHVHDVFLPAEYPREWIVDQHRFWNEQYLVQAFLAFNTSWEVLWMGSFLHLHRPDLLESAFASYDKDQVTPGSLWIRRTA